MEFLYGPTFLWTTFVLVFIIFFMFAFQRYLFPGYQHCSSFIALLPELCYRVPHDPGEHDMHKAFDRI